jgi:hypothetical protein
MVSTATARPTHCADSQFAAAFDYIAAQTVNIGYGTFFADKDAVIYDSAEIFKKYRMKVFGYVMFGIWLLPEIQIYHK